MRTKLVGLLILVALGLILDQCTSAKRDDAGQITKSGDVSAFEIQVGDCFKDLPQVEQTTLSSVSAVPCNEAHHWQAFASSSITLSEYSEAGVKQAASVLCSERAETLVINMSAIKFDAFQSAGLTYFYPTSKSWNSRSDRSVDCLIGSDTNTYFASVLD